MKRAFELLTVLGASVWALPVQARLELGSPFADHAVLQSGKPIPVWGWSDPGEEVLVTFAGQEKLSTVSGDGFWRVTLAPLPVSRESRKLTVAAGRSGHQWSKRIAVDDVLVGEVWLCSGQSNMEFSLCSGAARVRDRDGGLAAQMTDRPFVRYMNCSCYQVSAVPLSRAQFRCCWEKLTPNMLRRHGISAVGVYYALELYSALGVPVGIIAAAWGGTSIAPWIPREGLVGRSGLEDVLADIPSADAEASRKMAKPTTIYNALVAPLVPYAMRGIVWYQGESDRRDAKRYALKMKAYFDGMREVFDDSSLRLYFCQIAPWKHGGPEYFDVRLQQAKFAEDEPCADMVVTADLGNADEIHPYEKAPVAKRLAAYALRNDYGWNNLECGYPTPVSATAIGAVVCVKFKNGKGLAIYNLNGKSELNVELAGSDGVFRQATLVEMPKAPSFALPDGELRVVADGIAAPERVRYLYDSGAFGAIVNGIGLPSGPFELQVTRSQ